MSSLEQRWEEGHQRWRAPGEVVRRGELEVAPIASDSVAKGFVTLHHYSGTYPAARFRFGLYRRGALVGVAVFSHPASDRVLTSVFRAPAREAVELGRFVLLGEVAFNGETFFLARAFEALRAQGIRGVVSFSDPMRRTNRHGETVFGGHIGTIYQAHNGRYLGRSKARTLHLLPDGQVFSDRAAQKVRAMERGWEYAAAQLVCAGAPHVPAAPTPASLAAWLKAAAAKVCRRMPHPGNHRYAWALPPAPGSRGVRRLELPPAQPRPRRALDLFGVAA